ncbi:MAG: hypothetical protein NTW48_07595 [Chloroflexi bacterium]|nr:hypothetical protein [Chloroflexota bacterium]
MAGTSVIAGGSVIVGAGGTTGMVSVTAAEVDSGSAGSVAISGDGVAAATESGVGSFVASTVCKVDGAGSVVNSVIIGGSIAASMGYVANAVSGAGAGSAESVTAGEVGVGSTGSVVVSGEAVAGGSAVVMALAAMGSVVTVSAVASAAIGWGKSIKWGGPGHGEGCGLEQGGTCG